jgi:hypothetical protein
MDEPGQEPVFELVPVADEAGQGWLLVRKRPERRVVRRFDDHETARLVMQAMEAVEHESPNESAH